MIFQVTDKHIQAGRGGDCAACPIALCIQEAMHDPLFQTDGEVVMHAGYCLWLPLPDEAHEWASDFDEHGPGRPEARDICLVWGQPFSFELPLEHLLGAAYTHHPATGLPFLQHYRKRRAEEHLRLTGLHFRGLLTEEEYERQVEGACGPDYGSSDCLRDLDGGEVDG